MYRYLTNHKRLQSIVVTEQSLLHNDVYPWIDGFIKIRKREKTQISYPRENFLFAAIATKQE